MVVDPERPWLGGYFPEGDPGSYCPELWEWALDRFRIASVIDVGCGAGTALDWFAAHGCAVFGVDGLPPKDVRIIEHDYTLASYVPEREFDLCWSCEFVEHVQEEFIPNFVATFKRARYLMMTHGLYWQGGHHHVNCARPEYWINQIEASGFRLLGRETIESRDRTLQHYWKHSGLIFRRR
jgi:SAM-dependent methyltransferase